jgi:hypothetical protein
LLSGTAPVFDLASTGDSSGAVGRSGKEVGAENIARLERQPQTHDVQEGQALGHEPVVEDRLAVEPADQAGLTASQPALYFLRGHGRVEHLEPTSLLVNERPKR